MNYVYNKIYIIVIQSIDSFHKEICYDYTCVIIIRSWS